MNQRNGLKISAAPVAYVILCSVWMVLIVAYLFLYFRVGTKGLLLGAAIAAVVGSGTWLWLRGFVVTLDASFLEYRDGLYRHFRMPRGEISRVQTSWIGWKFLGRRLSLPRLIVHSHTGTSILINPKPFRTADLRQLQVALSSSSSSNV